MTEDMTMDEALAKCCAACTCENPHKSKPDDSEPAQ